MRAIPSFPLFFCFLLFPLWAVAAEPPPSSPAGTALKSGEGASADSTTDQADEPSPASNVQTSPRGKTRVRATSVAVITEPSGLKSLNIGFPWSLFPDSSVEVRLVPSSEAKGAEVAPIYFHEHLKGKVRDDFYDCLDHPENGGKTHSFTKDKVVYTMVGRRNSLGNQGVHVQVANEKPKKDDSVATAYLQLDAWAVDKKTLSLDLARDEFAQPGTLFVWFFRGDKAVWDEQVRWPGYK